MNEQEGWDWAWLHYMGTVLLNKREEEFWRTTPRSLFASWDVHKKVNGMDSAISAQAAAPGYIDQFI